MFMVNETSPYFKQVLQVTVLRRAKLTAVR